MKFNKLVQTILNEYDEAPGMMRYYKWDPVEKKWLTSETFWEDEKNAEYIKEKYPKEDGWFADFGKNHENAKEAAEEKFAKEKGKKQ